ncbi:MAG: antibiotic biosynthesis monooxygenase [Calditrichaeota bacterium]|nr:antibiotic biosynthesis monooxygenase [Calditrichota bacterium]
MIATTVFVHVKDENIEDFISATIANHNGSVQEPGNLRFDVLQSKEDPSRFLLYEAYETQDAAAAHTPHYLKWRESVAPWMAEPRQGVHYNSLAP